MKKNQKGFTLVELLAVIVILAVIILIAVNAVLPQMKKARKNSFQDEALNFAKAAETAHVADLIDDHDYTCYTVEYLKSKYVTKADDSYTGFVVLTPTGDDNYTKTVTIKNSSFMVRAKATAKASDVVVEDYNASDWTTAMAAKPQGCIDVAAQNNGGGE